MRLSIIIVSWNVRDELLDCLHSIEQNRPSHSYEVIVVDNASTDGTIDAVQKDFPDVRSLVNAENRGFAAANNVGVEQARGHYILFLNPDTILHWNSLDVLIEFMDAHEDVGACGPKLLYGNGTIQPSVRHFPDFRSALYQNTVFRNLRLFHRQYRRYRMFDFDFETQTDVDIVMGAALMTRRSIIDELGAMDERFFMYYEEADLCYRIIKAGWRIVFVPQAVITHLGGSSADQLPIRTRIMRLKSLLTFFRKHRGRFNTWMFSCVFKSAILLKHICNIASGVFMCILATMTFNKRRRRKCAVKVRDSAQLLGQYSWQLLFRI